MDNNNIKTEDATNIEESYGTISFADEVISTIAGLATIEIEGVAGMSGRLVDGFTEFLGKKNFSKGIKVAVGKEDVSIDISIVVNYGVSIPQVCKNIQKSVVEAIKTMTGLRAAAVNVRVQGLVFKETPFMEESSEKTEMPSK